MKYKGFKIETRPAQFTVQAIAKGPTGQAVKIASGNTKEEAIQKLKNKIDHLLADNGK